MNIKPGNTYSINSIDEDEAIAQAVRAMGSRSVIKPFWRRWLDRALDAVKKLFT